VLALLACAGTALAQSTGGVPIAGQSTISGSNTQPQIALNGDATDGSGWHLQATLVAQNQGASRRGGFGRSAAIPLSGQFTLSHTGITPIGGDVTGSVDQSGSGQVRLLGTDGTTSLDGSIAIDGSGNFTLNLTGALPVVSASTPAAGAQVANVNHTFWYISRASGLTAYVLLVLTVCFGLLVRTRVMDWLMARWRWFDLHQFTALLALGFIALHIFSLLGDQFIGFRLDQLFIPFTSSYRPIWTAFGIFSLYLTLVVVGSFYARRLIGYGAWRAIHYVTFGVFLLALLHGLLSGSDTGQLWDTGLYWMSCMLVGGLIVWRLTASERPHSIRTDIDRIAAGDTAWRRQVEQESS
jgi:hypothetical protein